MTFGINQFNCECGGLRHICAKWGHLPESRDKYQGSRPVTEETTVVWSGTLHRENAALVQLIPPREEHPDTRLWAMPTYDLDDGQVADVRPRRKYNRTGKHVKARLVGADVVDPLEESVNG